MQTFIYNEVQLLLTASSKVVMRLAVEVNSIRIQLHVNKQVLVVISPIVDVNSCKGGRLQPNLFTPRIPSLRRFESGIADSN